MQHFQSSAYQHKVRARPSILLCLSLLGSGSAYHSCLRARGRVHPGQVKVRVVGAFSSDAKVTVLRQILVEGFFNASCWQPEKFHKWQLALAPVTWCLPVLYMVLRVCWGLRMTMFQKTKLTMWMTSSIVYTFEGSWQNRSWLHRKEWWSSFTKQAEWCQFSPDDQVLPVVGCFFQARSFHSGEADLTKELFNFYTRVA